MDKEKQDMMETLMVLYGRPRHRDLPGQLVLEFDKDPMGTIEEETKDHGFWTEAGWEW